MAWEPQPCLPRLPLFSCGLRYASRVANAASPKHVSAEAAGSLIAFLETGALRSRRHVVMSRLRSLRDSEEFPSLPDDLQQKIRDVIDAERHRR